VLREGNTGRLGRAGQCRAPRQGKARKCALQEKQGRAPWKGRERKAPRQGRERQSVQAVQGKATKQGMVPS
jgi:hypothetical protein